MWWKKLLQIWKIKELRNSILFVAAMLVVFRIAAHIPIPGIDQEALKQFFNSNQSRVTGVIRMKLEAGHAIPVGRRSPFSLYSEKLATYSKGDTFDRKSAEGFMKLWGLPYEGMKSQRATP